MDTHVQYFNYIGLGEKLIGKEVLVRADLELDDPNPFEDADLGFPKKGIVKEPPDLFVNGVLNRFW